MAISKEVLIDLGRLVRAVTFTVAGEVSTREVFDRMAKEEFEIPGKDSQAKFRMLGILAEHGYPGARRGEPKSAKRYNKQVTMRPWLWRSVPQDAFEAWTSGAGPTPRVNVSAEIRALVSRVEQLEARVAEMEGGK